MFENPRRGRQERNFTTNAPKILDLKLSSEQIFSRKLPLGAPEICKNMATLNWWRQSCSTEINRYIEPLTKKTWDEFELFW